jgi:hypothetical protein
MAIFILSFFLAGDYAGAEKIAPRTDQVAMAYVPGNPLMQLPGMKPLPNTALPAATVPAPLPEPIITDVINAPNPFDSRKAGLEGQTQIMYTLAKDVPVRVTLYDLLGFRVRRWDFPAGQNGGRAGANHFLWDGANEASQKVSKGGYLAQIEIETPETVVTVIRKIGVIH